MLFDVGVGLNNDERYWILINNIQKLYYSYTRIIILNPYSYKSMVIGNSERLVPIE